jgi:hypothetical protein
MSFDATGPALWAPRWRWTDFEVLGYRTVTRAMILDPPPVELGTPIPEEERPWDPWCEELEERLDLHRAYCSPVYFAGGDGYLVIDVIEKGDEERGRFRPEPEGEVEIPAEVRRRFDAGCGEPIATLAERSVLGNVRDPAAELVAAWAAPPLPP